MDYEMVILGWLIAYEYISDGFKGYLKFNGNLIMMMVLWVSDGWLRYDDEDWKMIMI